MACGAHCGAKMMFGLGGCQVGLLEGSTLLHGSEVRGSIAWLKATFACSAMILAQLCTLLPSCTGAGA